MGDSLYNDEDSTTVLVADDTTQDGFDQSQQNQDQVQSPNGGSKTRLHMIKAAKAWVKAYMPSRVLTRAVTISHKTATVSRTLIRIVTASHRTATEMPMVRQALTRMVTIKHRAVTVSRKTATEMLTVRQALTRTVTINHRTTTETLTVRQALTRI